MKKVFACVFMFVVLLTSFSRFSEADENGSELFISYEGLLQVDPKSVNADMVLRQRLVTLRIDQIICKPGTGLVLNFFEDIVMTATCNRVENNSSGGFAWFGRLENQDTGEVTLVVTDQGMAGSVYFPEIVYHIRHYENNVYVVRKIQLPYFLSYNLSDAAVPITKEFEVAELVNIEREAVNLYPLMWNHNLFVAARLHSEDMALQNYFSHDSLDGRKLYQRISAAGYNYNTCAENIAAGYSSPQATMNQWMASEGHRNNILSNSVCDIGVGYGYHSASDYKNYWTQNFGRLQGVTVCPVYFTITASAGLHGSISPSGQVAVPYNGNQVFQITPDRGYQILDVKVDGLSKGAISVYSFTSVTKNHTIEAFFDVMTQKAMPWIDLLLIDH